MTVRTDPWPLHTHIYVHNAHVHLHTHIQALAYTWVHPTPPPICTHTCADRLYISQESHNRNLHEGHALSGCWLSCIPLSSECANPIVTGSASIHLIFSVICRARPLQIKMICPPESLPHQVSDLGGLLHSPPALGEETHLPVGRTGEQG